jgi:hypothetical protein
MRVCSFNLPVQLVNSTPIVKSSLIQGLLHDNSKLQNQIKINFELLDHELIEFHIACSKKKDRQVLK